MHIIEQGDAVKMGCWGRELVEFWLRRAMGKVRSFIRSFVCLFVRLFVCSFVRSI
jgi:hypothetical protein